MSDIGKITLPAMHSSFVTLLKMLSIKVWIRLVNLLEVMLGRRLVEYMISRKSEIFLFESHFKRLILKSPSNITSLFSLINFPEILDIHHWTHFVACMDIYICILLQEFCSPFRLLQWKQTPFVFFYKSLNLVLVYSLLLFWYTATLPH